MHCKAILGEHIYILMKILHCSFFSRPAIFTYNTVLECCLHITKNIEVDVRDICSNTFPFKTAKIFFWKSSACGKNFGGKSFTFTHDLVIKYFVFKYFLVLLVLILPNFTSNLFQSKSKKKKSPFYQAPRQEYIALKI